MPIITYAVLKCGNSLAIVALVLLEEINEVEYAVALATNEDVRCCHLALRFCKLKNSIVCEKAKTTKV